MDPVPSGSVGYSAPDPTLPVVFGFGALLQIGIHRYRDAQTRFHIDNFALVPQQPKDYTYNIPLWGEVNTLPVVRKLWTGDNREQLRAVTFELNKCIHWYLLDKTKPTVVEKTKKFFTDFFLPGLPSLKELYKGSCMVDTIQGWERMIAEGLAGRASYPIAPHLLDPRERQLVTDLTLDRINEAVKLSTVSGMTTDYKPGTAAGRILSETITIHEHLLKKYREYKLLPPYQPPPPQRTPDDEGSMLIAPVVIPL